MNRPLEFPMSSKTPHLIAAAARKAKALGKKWSSTRLTSDMFMFRVEDMSKSDRLQFNSYVVGLVDGDASDRPRTPTVVYRNAEAGVLIHKLMEEKKQLSGNRDQCIRMWDEDVKAIQKQRDEARHWAHVFKKKFEDLRITYMSYKRQMLSIAYGSSGRVFGATNYPAQVDSAEKLTLGVAQEHFKIVKRDYVELERKFLATLLKEPLGEKHKSYLAKILFMEKAKQNRIIANIGPAHSKGNQDRLNIIEDLIEAWNLKDPAIRESK